MTKRTKKTTSKQNRIYMVRTALALILVALFFAVGGGIIYVKNQTATQTFNSDFMKVQFDYPARYEVKEDTTDVILTNSFGKIFFGKSGTFFSNASEHVQDLAKTHLYAKTLISQDINISGLDGKKLLIESQGNQKYEYIFVKDYTIYQFEANDPALFSDLDAIAKSFRILD